MEERTIIRMGWIAIAVVVAVASAELACAKKGSCAAFADEPEEFTVEYAEMPKTWQIREDSGMSGMPCENREQFERWYETYEQEAGEKAGELKRQDDCDEVSEPETREAVSAEEAETSEETTWADTTARQTCPIYSVNGDTLAPDFQRWIYERLCDAGIEYWYETMLCQMYQESRFDQYAVSSDGRDYGILQFRKQFWDATCRQYGFDGADIYDPYVQAAVYIEQTKERINSGISGAEVLTRHLTSDYGTFDPVYYSDVAQWFDTMEEVTQ